MSNFFNEIDAREEFETILEGNEMNVLYVRSKTDTRCKCYDPLHGDGDSKCKICRGSGMLATIEKIGAFQNPISYDDTIKMSGQRITELGDVDVLTHTFYIKHTARPKVGDRILMVRYDKFKIPTEVEASCSIAVVRPVRGFNGRLEMYKVVCRSSPQLLTLDQKRLNSIPNLGKIKLMKGVRYKWGS